MSESYLDMLCLTEENRYLEKLFDYLNVFLPSTSWRNDPTEWSEVSAVTATDVNFVKMR